MIENAPNLAPVESHNRLIELAARLALASVVMSPIASATPEDFSPLEHRTTVSVSETNITESNAASPSAAPNTLSLLAMSSVIPKTATFESVNSMRRRKLRAKDYQVGSVERLFINRESVYLPGMGCSGVLVRDNNDEAVGATTAGHCGWLDNGIKGFTSPRFVEDGRTYLIMKGGSDVQLGARKDELQTVNTLKKMLVQSSSNNKMDIAIGAFAGHSLEEVSAHYNRTKLSTSELKNLKFGDSLYASGFPVNQPKHEANIERQDLKMAVLGIDKTETTAGLSLNVLWAAVPKNADGTECSYGMSGGGAFVMRDGQPKTVGTLSTFLNLVENNRLDKPGVPTANQKEFEEKYNVDLSGFAAVCAFSYNSPDKDKSSKVVYPVRSTSEIPGFDAEHSERGQLKNAAKHFFDPAYKKTILGGFVYNGDADQQGTRINYLKRPVIFYDSVVKSAVIASYSYDKKEHVEFNYIDKISDLTVFKPNANTPIHTETSVGKVTNVIDSKLQAGGFKDPQGKRFAEATANGEMPDTVVEYKIYTVTDKSGVTSFKPYDPLGFK